MSLQRLTSGTGYDYLTRQVAAQDATERGRGSLASYYSERGEIPGRWIGSGVGVTRELRDGLGIEGLQAGDMVTEEQMKSLFGLGLHPLANERVDAYLAAVASQEPVPVDGAEARRARKQLRAKLDPRRQRDVQLMGRPYNTDGLKATQLQQEIAIRASDFNKARGHDPHASIPTDELAKIRSEVGRALFADTYGRAPINERELAGFIAAQSRPAAKTVSGFDLTFSPVKSVSAVWALADPQLASRIEQAHNAAIDDALHYLEQHALYTRLGAHGVRQVDTTGLVATAFTHRDSRAGDPDLHTHVAVANKVQTLDGKWRTVDSRCLYRAAVTASETYNTALQTRLEALGLRFEQRVEPGRQKRPIYEVAGVDAKLLHAWSKRRGSIEYRQGQLASQFQADHGRPPAPVEMLRLAQQATLETRDAKHAPRTLAEQRNAWHHEAVATLGTEQDLTRMLHAVTHADAPRTRVDDAWIHTTAQQILSTLEQSRATWRETNIRAEAQRRVRGANVAPDRIDALVDLLADHVKDASTALQSGDFRTDTAAPDELRRRDGSSVYTVAGAARFTSASIIAAEQNLVALAGHTTAHTARHEAIDAAIQAQADQGRVLNLGQAQLVRSMALSGAQVQLAIAPAGSGKTTAMSALADAWRRDGHSVFGFAPSAAAATELGAQLDGSTDTLAKLVHELNDPLSTLTASIQRHDLVIIDEAAMADTLSLNAAVTALVQRGAVVRLVGDDQQLAAIGAGGVLRDIEHAHGAARLDELMRFSNQVEGLATLDLRQGRSEALGFYFDHNRIHVGDAQLVTQQLFDAWHADTLAGHDALMLAPTRDIVADLNRRARQARLADSPNPGPAQEVRLADGNLASAGDVIITRSNDRRLRISATDWVKNGDRWTITHTRPDGSIHAIHNQNGLHVDLPATYVTQAVELGWATTVHAAQGVSADTMHGLITGAETRQLFYTMMSRGRHANHAYLDYTTSGEPDSTVWAETTEPQTPTDVLHGILGRDGAPVSAISTERIALSPETQLAQAAAVYTDSLTVGAEEILGADQAQHIADHLELRAPGITDDPAYDTLRAHLLWAAADGEDVIARIDEAVTSRSLHDAHDRAAVLSWRLNLSPTLYQNGPLPWLPTIPAKLRDDKRWGRYLHECASQVERAATELRIEVRANPDVPDWMPVGMPLPTAAALADVAVWRAAHHIPASEQRITGPLQPGTVQARHQQALEARFTAPFQAARDEWTTLLRGCAPRIAADPQLDQLTIRLAALSRNQVPAHQLLLHAMEQGPLPDDHPAAAAWWRIVGDLTPAQQDAARRGRAEWTSVLPDRVGADIAAQLHASPAWPALETAVDHALDRGWALADLFVPVDPVPGRDLASELLWRILAITDQPADESSLTPDPRTADPEPDDLAGIEAATPADVASAEDAMADSAWWLRDAPDEEPGRVDASDTDADVREWATRADQWIDHPVPASRLYAVNAAAQHFFQQQLAGSWASTYLTERFGTDLADTPFQPGYAPNQPRALVNALQRQGFTPTELISAGVALESRYQPGELIDRFRDRVMLPIFDHTGHIAGFVGRRNPASDRGPKYLNTGETPIFHKGAQFFGTPNGQPNPDTAAVIVEGPMDAIAVTLAGDGRYTGLAPMGTSLTINQADLLAEHTQPVILATDHDLAGYVAAERDFWRLAAYGHDPLQAQFLPGDDPASQLQRDGAATLQDTLAHSTPAARQLQLERIRNLPADAALTQAAQVTAARPGSQWSSDVDWLARRLAVSQQTIEEHLAPLAQAWTADPRRCADDQIAASNDTRKRLQDHDPAAHWAHELAKIDPRLPEDPTWSYLVVALQAIQDEGLDPVVAARIIAEESPLGVSPASTLTVRLFDRLNLRPPSPALRPPTRQPDSRRRDEEQPQPRPREHDIPTF